LYKHTQLTDCASWTAKVVGKHLFIAGCLKHLVLTVRQLASVSDFRLVIAEMEPVEIFVTRPAD